MIHNENTRSARQLFSEAIALIDQGLPEAAQVKGSIAVFALQGSATEEIFCVTLESSLKEKRIYAIRELRTFPQGYGLKEAKDLIDAAEVAPTMVGTFPTEEAAQKAALSLAEVSGGTTRVDVRS